MSDEKKVPIPAGREIRPHIGIFGRCNSGKSSLLNFITDTPASIISPVPGTTTDTVRKSYEITGFSPVIFIDTAGIDDDTEIGGLRVRNTLEVISQIDLAIIVYTEWGEPETQLTKQLELAYVPVIAVNNIMEKSQASLPLYGNFTSVSFDILNGSEADRDKLLEMVKAAIPERSLRKPAMFPGSDIEGRTVLLVCPIDSEAPSGRLILPQVQAIRELLDKHAVAIVVQPEQLETVFTSGIKPELVVTDSQVFPEVRKKVPEDIEVTSFSILLAAAKGDVVLYEEGLEKVDLLKDGDRVLIAENCSHQVSCEDIGRVKIPAWLRDYTGLDLGFTVVSGLAPLPGDLGDYALMVQCGGCMVTRSQLQNRIRQATMAGVPVTNYGMLIRKIRK